MKPTTFEANVRTAARSAGFRAERSWSAASRASRSLGAIDVDTSMTRTTESADCVASNVSISWLRPSTKRVKSSLARPATYRPSASVTIGEMETTRAFALAEKPRPRVLTRETAASRPSRRRTAERLCGLGASPAFQAKVHGSAADLPAGRPSTNSSTTSPGTKPVTATVIVVSPTRMSFGPGKTILTWGPSSARPVVAARPRRTARTAANVARLAFTSYPPPLLA